MIHYIVFSHQFWLFLLGLICLCTTWMDRSIELESITVSCRTKVALFFCRASTQQPFLLRFWREWHQLYEDFLSLTLLRPRTIQRRFVAIKVVMVRWSQKRQYSSSESYYGSPPQHLFNGIACFATTPRPYLLKYGAPFFFFFFVFFSRE